MSEGRSLILIVDDDTELLGTLCEEFTALGYSTRSAVDGQLALDALQGDSFDAVILDLKLPKVDGFEILKFIKQHHPATKVIVLTAYANLGNVEKCKQMGADDVIEKPYELGDLFDSVKFHLGR